MNSGDTAISNISERKTIGPSSTPRDQAINTTSEDRASSSSRTSSSSSSSSSGGSPSDLRRRLQDLPSPNEFSLLADRVAALGRHICCKQEFFLRLQGAANRIEENDESEEKGQRAESESSLASSRPKDARARRRARIRLETLSRRDDKAMVISQAGDPTAPSKINDHDESNRAEFRAVDRSPARDGDHLRLPAIEMSRKPQSRFASSSEPSSTRLSHRDNHGSRSMKTNAVLHSSRKLAPRPADPPLLSPFPLSGLSRPRKFGGFRSSPGVVVKNLSSGSELEYAANEASRGFCCARKVDNSTVELSSPECKATVINGSVRKMHVMSARNNIATSVLPNRLLSTRSLDSNDLDRRTFQDTPGDYIAERVNRNGIKVSNQVSKRSTPEDAPEEVVCKQRVSSDRIESQSVESFATSVCNEREAGLAMRDYDKFKQEYENKHDEKEEEEAKSSRSVASKIHRDEYIKDQFALNRPTERCNLEGSSLDYIDEEILDTAKWDLLTDLGAKRSVNASHLTERVENDAAEDVLSSQTSEQIESEDQSRSSCTRMHLSREMLSSRRSKNDTDASDKCDQEMTMVMNVPTLVLNSQDISYSTTSGADSRECSATRPVDPLALIKALSDVSFRREKQGGRKREEDSYKQEKDTIDGASNFPTKGESTWRVPRSLESPRQPLSRVPSRIPIRISSSRIMSPIRIDKSSCCPKNVENSKIANCKEDRSIDQSDSQSGNITHRPEVNWRSENTEDTIVHARSRIFASDDEAAEYGVNEGDYEPRSLTSSNLQSPQSASFDDHAYDKTRRLPESGLGGTSCPSVFFNKTASGDRDCAKIDDDDDDDDVRSRSDCSASSRKSAETLDVTSATESPCLLKYKRDSIPREFCKDAEENVTWRTEDECPSINDEENPKDAKDFKTHYESYGSEPEELRSQTQERFGLGMHNLSSSSKIQLDLSSEVKRIIAKQRARDDPEFDKSSFDYNRESETHRTQEISSFVARMNCELKRKKKSQERFPFTISEASGALSTEDKDTSDCQLPKDKDSRRTKVDQQPEESAVRQLKMHPSITRLATSGLDDTVADILCCVVEQKDESSSRSRVKAFMRIFSSKSRKNPKQQSSDNKRVEPAKIIYKNRACQVDSRASSCSDCSSTEEARGINFKSADDGWTGNVSRSNPTFVSTRHILRKTESCEAIVREYPRVRYDRDDLWVQENEMDNLKESPSKDRYSIFLAKNFQSDNLSASNIDRSNSKKQHDVISDHVTPSDGKSEKDTDRKLPSSFRQFPRPELEGIEDLTSCFCWKLCRIIAPSKNRSLIKEQVTSPRIKRSGSPLRKRKKSDFCTSS